MTPALYDDMLRFAKRVLPYHTVLEPADLVTEALLMVGTSDVVILRKKIKGLAIQEMSYTASRSAFVEYNSKVKPVIETSKVCNTCDQEKGFNDFQKTYGSGGKIYYRNRCKACENERRQPCKNKVLTEEQKEKARLKGIEFRKRQKLRALYDPEFARLQKEKSSEKERLQWIETKSDPIKHAQAKAKAAAKRLREKQKRIDNPILLEEYKNRRRKYSKLKWQAIKSDPERLKKAYAMSANYQKRKKQEKCLNKLTIRDTNFNTWQDVRAKVKSLNNTIG